MWRELGDLGELAAALDSLGWPLVYDADDNPRSLEAFEQSLELHRELGDAAGETRALVGIAQVLVAMGETERAEAISLDLLDRAVGDVRTEHFAYHYLADCALIRGDTEEAETRYRQSLRAALPLGDIVETSFEVQGVAMSQAGGGNSRRAVILASSVEALWESLGMSVPLRSGTRCLSATSAPARASLGEELDAVHGRGPPLAFDDAVELALRDDAWNELLLEFARTAQDRELVRINPVRFAEQHGLTKGEAVDLFLHARKEGLVTMEWQYVCPGCGAGCRTPDVAYFGLVPFLSARSAAPNATPI